ncbi:Oidioi.mRNA.OKI2018_I69.chr2.g4308.t1.cds [Oikopleura dioica]|uniref:Oidioi.mRNA.OKI2018_I69.chr2.g4308.t1.cds n=1 Tax=Oikopleura dioica TaxID=34765 RepID=A0ABN7SXD2_OIKDI|nr:Oidioi.mRNA.OKI2018_I69.chr2.g4308.t1.cds [Oikopleura dioica]
MKLSSSFFLSVAFGEVPVILTKEQIQETAGKWDMQIDKAHKGTYDLMANQKYIHCGSNGDTIRLTCLDGYVDNSMNKDSITATCSCNESDCKLNLNKPYKCMKQGICPIPIWQGAFGHSLKDSDSDWALLDFKLRKEAALSEDIVGFTWDQWFPKDDNFTLVVACPFNVFGFEYAEEIDMDDIEQVTNQGMEMLKTCQSDELARLNLKENSARTARKNRKLKRLATRAAKKGRKARMNGDFTDKLCEMVKEERTRFDQYLKRKNILVERSSWAREMEYESECLCEKEKWAGREYYGKISTIDGRVTSASADGRLWTIVSKGTKGVESGARSFKIAIDMLNENSHIKWMSNKEMKAAGEKKQYTCELGIVSGYYPHLAPCLEKFHGGEIHKYMKNYKQAKKLGLINRE